ncbi:hypothetical protein KI387_014185, partial [Taxus chinensis]
MLAIFSYLTHDCVEIYMDDFTDYGATFQDVVDNLDNVLAWCEKHQLSLNHGKCLFMMEQGIVLGHHVSAEGIKVDSDKFSIIVTFPSPTNQTK